MPKKLTRAEFIERAKAIHGDKYNYDKVVYVNSSTKVIITCPKHGDFPQTHAPFPVCDEWLVFSNFKAWFDDPANGYLEGYHLDKDIIKQGNKMYSPETCCFVPHAINCIFGASTNKSNDLPIGVGYKHNRITAELSRYGKPCNLGYYDSVEEAFRAYKEAKEAYIKEVAAEYYSDGKITKRVYDALMRWEVVATD